MELFTYLFVRIFYSRDRFFSTSSEPRLTDRSRGRPHLSLFKFTACRFKLVVDGGAIDQRCTGGCAVAWGVVGGVGAAPGSHEGPLGAIVRPYGWDKCSGRFK